MSRGRPPLTSRSSFTTRPGACHVPHHVPSEWIDKYRGRFDQGWDCVREHTLARQKRLGVVPLDTELPPRPDWIPAWDQLFLRRAETLCPDDGGLRRLPILRRSPDRSAHRRAGEEPATSPTRSSSSSRTTAPAPRVAWQGRSIRADGSTAVPEGLEENLSRLDQLGGPSSYNHYPAGWAMAGNTPLKGFKGDVFEGGTKVPTDRLLAERYQEPG